MSCAAGPGRHSGGCGRRDSAAGLRFLYDAGVAGIYGPGTVIPVAAQKILEMLSAQVIG
jgi:methylmalonyl-CoA mutase cobalamin-binding subunit